MKKDLSKELSDAIKLINQLGKERLELREEYVRMRNLYSSMFEEYSRMCKDLHDFKKIVIKTKVRQDFLIVALEEAKVLNQKKSLVKGRESIQSLYRCYRYHGVRCNDNDVYDSPEDYKL